MKNLLQLLVYDSYQRDLTTRWQNTFLYQQDMYVTESDIE